jgi:hypothetical protein
LGEDAEMRMVSSGPPDIAVEMVRGDSILEVDQLLKGVGLSILMDSSTTDIAKQGLYVSGGGQRFIGVLDGEATVHQGSAHVTLKKTHGVILLSGQRLKSQKLDLAVTERHPLFIWSESRSACLAPANIQAAQDILAFADLMARSGIGMRPWIVLTSCPRTASSIARSAGAFIRQ